MGRMSIHLQDQVASVGDVAGGWGSTLAVMLAG